ncbi:hypothetical protein Gotur_032747 [Gossypium turneri]
MPGFPMYAAENILDSDENFLGLLLFDIGSASRSPIFNRKYRHNKKGVQKLEEKEKKKRKGEFVSVGVNPQEK